MQRTPRTENSEAVDYDWLVIGSSPISVMEALYLRARGNRVVIIEARDRIGGAWTSTDFEEFSDVDLGPHVVDRDRRTYDFLKDYIGCDMQPVSPTPYQYVGTTRYNYESTASYLHGAALHLAKMGRNIVGALTSPLLSIAYLVARNTKAATEALRKAQRRLKSAHHYGRLAGKSLRNAVVDGFWNSLPLQFPKGGAPELIHNLRVLLEEANIPVFFNEQIDRLHLYRDEGLIRLQLSKQTLTSKQVLMTSGSAIPEFLDGNQAHHFPLQTWTSLNRCLIIEEASPPDFSYVHCTYHPIIDMAYEATAYVQPKATRAKHYRVILTLLRSNYKPNERTIDEIMHQLAAWGVVGQSARLVKVYSLDHTNPMMTREAMRDLERRFAPFLKTLSSTNLSHGIAQNTARWASALDPWKPPRHHRHMR